MYDAASGRLRGLGRIARLVHHFAVSRSRIWVTDHEGAQALVLRPPARILARVRTGGHPHHVALYAGVAVVVNQDDGTISIYDAGRGRTLRAPLRVGHHPHGVVLVLAP